MTGREAVDWGRTAKLAAYGAALAASLLTNPLLFCFAATLIYAYERGKRVPKAERPVDQLAQMIMLGVEFYAVLMITFLAAYIIDETLGIIP